MPRVLYNNRTIAESEQTEQVEGNHYFPAASLDHNLLVASDTQYTCPWKGAASYYHLKLGEETLTDAVWAYHKPKEAAKNIAGHFAFDKRQVSIQD